MRWAIRTHGSVKGALQAFGLATLATTAPMLVYLLAGQPFGWYMLFPPSLVPLVLMGLLAHQHGSPMNWWQFFWGTEVQTAKEHCFDGSDYQQPGLFALKEEVVDWLASSPIAGWRSLPGGVIQFRRKRDAVLFKLTWG